MFEYSLFIDVDRPGGLSCLMDGRASSALQDTPRVAQSDIFLLKLYFRKRGATTAPSTTADVDPGAIVFAGKKADNLGALTLLFSAIDFVAVGAEDDAHYEAVLDLTSDELSGAFGTEKSITARVDVELQNGDNTRRLTYQFDMIVSRQAYGGEANPMPGTPAYPPPSSLLTRSLAITTEIAEAAQEVVVDLSDLALGAAPAAVLPIVRSPSAEAVQIFAASVHTVTAEAATVCLSAAAPASGYTLQVLVIP